jgi:hypothetical protein
MIRLLRYLASHAWGELLNRIAPLATPEQDACESCREPNCDCTKVKTCKEYQNAAGPR